MLVTLEPVSMHDDYEMRGYTVRVHTVHIAVRCMKLHYHAIYNANVRDWNAMSDECTMDNGQSQGFMYHTAACRGMYII